MSDLIYYDEHGNLIESPDLTAGYTYTRHLENGTEKTVYHAYTEDELAEIEAAKNKTTPEARIAALENALKAIEEGIASV